MTRLGSVSESRPLDPHYDPIYQSPFQSNSFVSLRKPVGPHETSQVAGGDRYKFFKRPVVPVLDALPAEIILAPTVAGDPLVPPPVPIEPLTKEFAVQTDYRESEAQTEPYTPDYILPEGCPDPELLLLQDLTYARGLEPVTLLEVQHIEFQRRRHIVTSSLPPATDEASLRLRKRILENLELQSFKLREAEIDRNRQAKLVALRQALQERNEAQEYADEQRVEATRQELLSKRDASIEKIQSLRLQVLRKLSKERNEYTPPGERKGRDIIMDYAHLSSKAYAQVTRDGTVSAQHLRSWIDHSSGPPGHKLAALETLQKSLSSRLFTVDVTKALENHMANKHHVSVSASATAGERPGASSSAARNRAAILKANLELMDKILRKQKEGGDAAKDDGHHHRSNTANTSASESAALYKGAAKKGVDRPPTPTVAAPTHDELLTPHILLLQRLLRGRAVQNVMYEGKERRRELIKEMRLQEREDLCPPSPQSQRPTEEDRREAIVESTLDTIAGAVVSHMLEARVNMGQQAEEEEDGQGEFGDMDGEGDGNQEGSTDEGQEGRPEEKEGGSPEVP